MRKAYVRMLIRLDFERVVPWRPNGPKVDCRWAGRDLRRRHYTGKIDRSTNLHLEVASWRRSGLAQMRSPRCPLFGRYIACPMGWNAEDVALLKELWAADGAPRRSRVVSGIAVTRSTPS